MIKKKKKKITIGRVDIVDDIVSKLYPSISLYRTAERRDAVVGGEGNVSPPGCYCYYYYYYIISDRRIISNETFPTTREEERRKFAPSIRSLDVGFDPAGQVTLISQSN